MNEIKLGDIVKLNSGGPDMAVVGINSKNVMCQWGDDFNRSFVLSFDIRTVTKQI